VHANAQLFCSLGPQDRENRQPLDRERDLKSQGEELRGIGGGQEGCGDSPAKRRAGSAAREGEKGWCCDNGAARKGEKEKRHHILALIDVFSRRVMFHVAPSEG